MGSLLGSGVGTVVALVALAATLLAWKLIFITCYKLFIAHRLFVAAVSYVVTCVHFCLNLKYTMIVKIRLNETKEHWQLYTAKNKVLTTEWLPWLHGLCWYQRLIV